MAGGLALPFVARPAHAAITWTLFCHHLDQSTAAVRGLRRMSDQIRDRTAGGMLLTVRTAGTLPIDANEVLEGVRTGQVEMGDDPVYNATILPATVLRLPLLVTAPEEFGQASAVLRPFLEANLAQRGLVLVGHYRSAMQLFWSREKAASFADIARQRLRVLSVEQGEFVRHYLGLHLTMANAEMADALAEGRVDGTFSTAFLVGRRWKAALKHVYLAGPNYNDSIIVAGSAALERLPADMRAVVQQAAVDAGTWIARTQDSEDQQILRTLAGEGLKVTPADPNEIEAGIQKLAPFWDNWVRLRGSHAENLLARIRQTLDR